MMQSWEGRLLCGTDSGGVSARGNLKVVGTAGAGGRKGQVEQLGVLWLLFLQS